MNHITVSRTSRTQSLCTPITIKYMTSYHILRRWVHELLLAIFMSNRRPRTFIVVGKRVACKQQTVRRCYNSRKLSMMHYSANELCSLTLRKDSVPSPHCSKETYTTTMCKGSTEVTYQACLCIAKRTLLLRSLDTPSRRRSKTVDFATVDLQHHPPSLEPPAKSSS